MPPGLNPVVLILLPLPLYPVAFVIGVGGTLAASITLSFLALTPHPILPSSAPAPTPTLVGG